MVVDLSKTRILLGFMMILSLHACKTVPDDEGSALDGSDKKSYNLRCIADLIGPVLRVSMVETGTKQFRLEEPKLVESKKEKDEYKALLSKLSGRCTIQAPGSGITPGLCASISLDKDRKFERRRDNPSLSNLITLPDNKPNVRIEIYCLMNAASA
jgi:hypothetical protein